MSLLLALLEVLKQFGGFALPPNTPLRLSADPPVQDIMTVCRCQRVDGLYQDKYLVLRVKRLDQALVMGSILIEKAARPCSGHPALANGNRCSYVVTRRERRWPLQSAELAFKLWGSNHSAQGSDESVALEQLRRIDNQDATGLAVLTDVLPDRSVDRSTILLAEL